MCDSQWISLCASTAHTCAMIVAKWPKLVFRSSEQRLASNCQMPSSASTPPMSSLLLNSVHKIRKSVLFFSLVFINLFLFPNTSHAFRVPYRYPHYPLFHKELIHNSPIGKIALHCSSMITVFHCSCLPILVSIVFSFQTISGPLLIRHHLSWD